MTLSQRLQKSFSYVRYALLFLIVVLGSAGALKDFSPGIAHAMVITAIIFFANSMFELFANYLVVKEEMAEENRK